MIKNQKGLTAITWVIVIGFLSVQGIMGLRVIPVYMNYGSLQKIMDALPNDSDAKGKTPKKIRQILLKRLNINSLYSLEKNKSAFKFEKTSDGLRLKAKYEERGPILGNLEFVATFEHEVFFKK